MVERKQWCLEIGCSFLPTPGIESRRPAPILHVFGWPCMDIWTGLRVEGAFSNGLSSEHSSDIRQYIMMELETAARLMH
jgi:hypothetical protein